MNEAMQSNGDHLFGSCPECGADPDWINTGPEYWCFCEKHRIAWHIGYNVFSNWRNETEKDWERNDAFLQTCTFIEAIEASYGIEQRQVDAVAAELLDWLE